MRWLLLAGWDKTEQRFPSALKLCSVTSSNGRCTARYSALDKPAQLALAGAPALDGPAAGEGVERLDGHDASGRLIARHSPRASILGRGNRAAIRPTRTATRRTATVRTLATRRP